MPIHHAAGETIEVDLDTHEVRVLRVVSAARGSWRWQDAYRIAWYAIRYSPRQRAHCYVSVARSGKMSRPQLQRAGIDYLRGSLHNRRVPADIMQAIGALEAI